MIKVLGQISAIIRSTTEPTNTDIVWVDINTNPAVLKTYDGSDWIPIAGDALGMIRMAVGDTPGYLGSKIDDTLDASGNTLKVAIPVLEAEKTRWNKSITTYFVDNVAERDSLTPLDGDECFYPKSENPSLYEGWKWDDLNSVWRKFSDQNWENSEVLFEQILDGESAVNDIIDSRVGFADPAKLLNSDVFGNKTVQVSDTTLNLTQDGFLIQVNGTTGTPYYGYTIQNITLNSAALPNGKTLIISNINSSPLFLRKVISSGYGINHFNKGSKITIDSTFESLQLAQYESAMLIKVTDNEWYVMEVFENKNTAYNKSFGYSTTSIPQIGTDLVPYKTVRTNNSGQLVTSELLSAFGPAKSYYDYALDLSHTDLIADGTWKTLTISTSKVPSVNCWILVRVVVISDGIDGDVSLKDYNQSADYDISSIYTNGAGQYSGDCWIRCNSSRQIKYRITSNMKSVYFTIGGYSY